MDVTRTIPDELLIEIFEYLPIPDRLNCRSVCARWGYLLMRAGCFKANRTIFLNDCVIDADCPPASIFLNSSSTYHTLHVSGLQSIHENSVEFWRHLGEYIVELKFFQTEQFYEEFLPIFQHLKTVQILHLNNMLEIFEFFTENMHEVREFLLNIEEIHFVCSVENLKQANALVLMMPNLKKIYCSIFKLTQDKDWMDLLDFYLEHAPKLKSLSVNLDDWQLNTPSERHDPKMELFMLDVLSRCRLEEIHYETKADFECLQIIHGMQSKLKTIKIRCNVIPPCHLTQITDLHLKLYQKIDSFKPLVQLKQLKNLYLDLNYTQELEQRDCFFGHDALDFSHIRSLFFHKKQNSCSPCMESFIKSLWLLESFVFNVETFEMHEWKLIFNTIKTLKSFHSVNTANSIQGLLHIENDYRALKDFRLFGLEKVTEENINAICKTFPNLKYLTIMADHWDFDSLDIIYELILSQLKFIKQFDLRISRMHVYKRPTNTLPNVIEKFGSNLRTLHLPYNWISLTKKLQLFESLEKLQIIFSDNNVEVTRADYIDACVRKTTPLKDLKKYLDAKLSDNMSWF